MKEFVTGEALANWLGMLRVVDKRTFLLVEGPSDAQALDPQIDSRVAKTFPAYSKPKVLKALESAEARGMERIVALVDLDWDGLLHPTLSSANVVYTDDYDLDATMLLAGDVLERIVSNHSDRSTRERFLMEHGVSLQEAVVDLASTIGAMRYLSERDSYCIRCRDFPVHAVVTESGSTVDVQVLAKVAVRRSPGANVEELALAVSIEKQHSALDDRRRFANGHDIAGALSALLHRWGGNTSRDAVERIARAAFGCPELKETAMFREVAEWATAQGTHVWSCG